LNFFFRYYLNKPVKMQVSKQLLINNIQLPDDVLNIIKGFCFYDMPTGISRLFITERKQEICRIFNKCIIYSGYFSDKYHDDTEQYWIFLLSQPNVVIYGNTRNKLYLQCLFCCICGNLLHYSRGATPQNVCKCEIHR